MKNIKKVIKNVIKKKLNESSNRVNEYGCLMVFFDFPQLKDIQSLIDPNDVYDEPGYGLEDEPHVTILYGFHDDVSLEDIKDKIKGIKIGYIKLNDPSLFENEYDVLKFTADGEGLYEANSRVVSLPHTTDYPDYNPHSTIGYIKKGMGSKYVELLKQKGMDNFTLKPLYFVYSEPNGNKTKFTND